MHLHRVSYRLVSCFPSGASFRWFRRVSATVSCQINGSRSDNGDCSVDQDFSSTFTNKCWNLQRSKKLICTLDQDPSALRINVQICKEARNLYTPSQFTMLPGSLYYRIFRRYSIYIIISYRCITLRETETRFCPRASVAKSGFRKRSVRANT